MWLVIGIALLVFSTGKFIIPIAPWLALMFLLRYSRSVKPLTGFIAISILSGLVYTFSWQGMVPVKWIPPLMGTYFGIIILIDRVLYPRLPMYTGIFIFPTIIVVCEYLNMLTNPMGNWGALGYTQYGFQEILQLSSIGGVPLISFLIAFTASSSAAVWSEKFKLKQSRIVFLIVVLVMASSLLFGRLRIHNNSNKKGTITIASITTEKNPRQIWNKMYCLDPLKDKNDLAAIQKMSNQNAFAAIESLLGMDPSLVMTHETAFSTLPEKKDLLFKEASLKAKEWNKWFIMSFSVIGENVYENRIRIYSPYGTAVADQYKFGGALVEGFTKWGDGEPAVFTVNGVKVGTYICWDLDFPLKVSKLARHHPDLLLVPAADWKEIDPVHTHMAVFRAVELGTSIVRQTAEGLSIACDPAGNIVNSNDHFTANRLFMISEVPSKSANTLYSGTVHFFPILCCATLLIMVALAIVKKQD